MGWTDFALSMDPSTSRECSPVRSRRSDHRKVPCKRARSCCPTGPLPHPSGRTCSACDSACPNSPPPSRREESCGSPTMSSCCRMHPTSPSNCSALCRSRSPPARREPHWAPPAGWPSRCWNIWTGPVDTPTPTRLQNCDRDARLNSSRIRVEPGPASRCRPEPRRIPACAEQQEADTDLPGRTTSITWPGACLGSSMRTPYPSVGPFSTPPDRMIQHSVSRLSRPKSSRPAPSQGSHLRIGPHHLHKPTDTDAPASSASAT